MTIQMPVETESFRAVFSQHPGAVGVITTMHHGAPVGFTATSVVSVSAQPPMLLFTIMEESSSFTAVANNDHVSVHLLNHTDENIARTFSTRGIDRFSELPWATTAVGTPAIEQVERRLDCSIVSRTKAGSSYVILCEIDSVTHANSGKPLLYAERKFHHLP